MARGKALVAKLRAQPETRDAEALAAWIGRKKKYKRMGASDKVAANLAGKKWCQHDTQGILETFCNPAHLPGRG